MATNADYWKMRRIQGPIDASVVRQAMKRIEDYYRTHPHRRPAASDQSGRVHLSLHR